MWYALPGFISTCRMSHGVPEPKGRHQESARNVTHTQNTMPYYVASKKIFIISWIFITEDVSFLFCDGEDGGLAVVTSVIYKTSLGTRSRVTECTSRMWWRAVNRRFRIGWMSSRATGWKRRRLCALETLLPNQRGRRRWPNVWWWTRTPKPSRILTTKPDDPTIFFHIQLIFIPCVFYLENNHSRWGFPQNWGNCWGARPQSHNKIVLRTVCLFTRQPCCSKYF